MNKETRLGAVPCIQVLGAAADGRGLHTEQLPLRCPPGGVTLATGDSFSRLELPPGVPVVVGQVGIKDADYRMELPEEL